MSAAAVLEAERIKLSTTRSVLWTAAAVAVLSVGLAALQGSTAYGAAPLLPEKAAIGVVVFGVPVLMVLAAMTVTGEYRSGMIRTTFMATPDRTLVLVAKATHRGTVFRCVRGRYDDRRGGDRARDDPSAGGLATVLHRPGHLASHRRDHAVRGAHRRARGGRRCAAAAFGRCGRGAAAVAAASRADTGESARVSARKCGPFLPFANVLRFLNVQWLFPTYAMPWGETGSLLYFIAVVAVVYVAAIVVLNRRDA